MVINAPNTNTCVLHGKISFSVMILHWNLQYLVQGFPSKAKRGRAPRAGRLRDFDMFHGASTWFYGEFMVTSIRRANWYRTCGYYSVLWRVNSDWWWKTCPSIPGVGVPNWPFIVCSQFRIPLKATADTHSEKEMALQWANQTWQWNIRQI